MTTQDFQPPALQIPRGIVPGIADALRHWHEHRPRMYADLHEEGTLVAQATAAFESTLDDLDKIKAALIEQQGYDSPTAFVLAQQMVRERYIYLPTEEDVPELMRTESGLYTYESEQGGQ